jgi:hypothetical protein
MAVIAERYIDDKSIQDAAKKIEHSVGGGVDPEAIVIAVLAAMLPTFGFCSACGSVYNPPMIERHVHFHIPEGSTASAVGDIVTVTPAPQGRTSGGYQPEPGDPPTLPSTGSGVKSPHLTIPLGCA